MTLILHYSQGHPLHHTSELIYMKESKNHYTKARPVMDFRYQSNGYLTICQTQSGDKPRPFDKPGNDTDDDCYEKQNCRYLGDGLPLHRESLFYLEFIP